MLRDTYYVFYRRHSVPRTTKRPQIDRFRFFFFFLPSIGDIILYQIDLYSLKTVRRGSGCFRLTKADIRTCWACLVSVFWTAGMDRTCLHGIITTYNDRTQCNNDDNNNNNDNVNNIARPLRSRNIKGQRKMTPPKYYGWNIVWCRPPIYRTPNIIIMIKKINKNQSDVIKC